VKEVDGLRSSPAAGVQLASASVEKEGRSLGGGVEGLLAGAGVQLASVGEKAEEHSLRREVGGLRASAGVQLATADAGMEEHSLGREVEGLRMGARVQLASVDAETEELSLRREIKGLLRREVEGLCTGAGMPAWCSRVVSKPCIPPCASPRALRGNQG